MEEVRLEKKDIRYFITFVYKTSDDRYIYKNDIFEFLDKIKEIETIRKMEQLIAFIINKENDFKTEIKDEDVTIINFIKMN